MADPYANPFAGPPDSLDANFYYNQQPLAGYYAWLYGLSPDLWGSSNLAKFAQGSFGRYQSQYAADAARDPMLQWYDWLRQKNVNPQAEFQEQSPEQRGDFSSRISTPRAKWVISG